MKKIGLLLILAGLLIGVAGCGSGGGSDGGDGSNIITSGFDSRAPGTYQIKLSYDVNTSSGDTVRMIVDTIRVNDDFSLKVNCTWQVIVQKRENVAKLSDANKKTFYIIDNQNKEYYHTAGDGAAYTEKILSATPVAGSYDFPALRNGIRSFYFFDSDCNQKTDVIKVSGSN